MERKDPSPGGPEAEAPAPGPEGRSQRGRRRFGEGETTILRLDELLRSRPTDPAEGGPSGEKTQVVSLADLQQNLAQQTQRTLANADLSQIQKALLQRTEPRASSDHAHGGAAYQADAPASVWDTQQAPAAPLVGRKGSLLHAASADDDGPGIATQIGPPPSRQASGRPAAPPPARAAAVEEAAPPPPPPWRPRHDPSVATSPGQPLPPTRDHATPPPLPPLAARATEPSQSWPDEVPPQPQVPRPSATPPPLPQRTGGRDARTDPGPGGVKVRAAAATPARPSATSSEPAKQKRKVANQVVVFFACKGGAGTTALAANTAWSANRRQQTACVVDIDLQLGDALASFGLSPRFSVAQAVHLLQEKQPLTRSLLPSHSSGVHVLSQVGNLNDLDKISPETLANVLLALRQQFDTVVVDGVRDFSDNVLAVLDGADKVVIVCVQEVLAIRRARWTFGILRKIGFEAADLSLVVNRYSEGNEIPLSSISSMFEGAQVVPIGADASVVTQSLNRGVPLAEVRGDHFLVAEMGKLCDHVFFDDAAGALTPELGAAEPKEGNGFLQRMFKGKSTRTPA